MPPHDAHDRTGLHPDVAGWVLQALDHDDAMSFAAHLRDCEECRAAVAELRPVAQATARAAPALEPPADLGARTLVAVQQAAAAEPRRAKAPVKRAKWWRWPWSTPLVSVASALAGAAVAAVIVVPLSTGGGRTVLASVTVVTRLHATAAAKAFGVGAATARATARQAGESWTFDLTVHGLKPLHGNDFYECWWAAPGSTKLHPALATGGSFVVGKSGSTTLTMTTGVDPRQFRTMVITAESPGSGALHGPVLLTGRSVV